MVALDCKCHIKGVAKLLQAHHDQKLQRNLRVVEYDSIAPNTFKHIREPRSCFLSRRIIVTVRRGASNKAMCLKQSKHRV